MYVRSRHTVLGFLANKVNLNDITNGGEEGMELFFRDIFRNISDVDRTSIYEMLL
jgi:hypothetical protein